jgi:hypothetical protein
MRELEKKKEKKAEEYITRSRPNTCYRRLLERAIAPHGTSTLSHNGPVLNLLCEDASIRDLNVADRGHLTVVALFEIWWSGLLKGIEMEGAES